MDEVLTQKEHQEFVKRMESAHSRYDKRLEQAENAINEIRSVQSDIKTINLNIERILETLSKQETRLDTIEERDGDMWRTVVKYAATAIVSVLVGYAFAQIGM